MQFRTPLYFHTPWKGYYLSEMEQFGTGGEAEPLVYVAQDRTCVFVQTPEEGASGEAHRAEPAEIASLWERRRITALLAVCKVTGSPPPQGSPGPPERH